MKFSGKTALITGSGTGIGLAIARKFVRNGASVIILGRRKEPLEEAAKELRGIIQESSSTDASVRIFAGVDVADESSVNAMFDKLASEGSTIDYMINNAGVSGPVTCFANASIDDFRSTIHIHLTGTFWGSVQALRVLNTDGKIVTISTFFTEERPLEQRPYRFRSPYTASQGAKNRLAELLSWELAETGVASIATNPGPVHSDRIYKTVYPKAAAEFMRVSGFEDMIPSEVEELATKKLLPLLGEDEKIISDGVASAARSISHEKGITEDAASKTVSGLLAKIQYIAEKVQKNTSRMIANQEFLSQDQVAESILNLCDDAISSILDGKVVPGDRVFYPVKPHVSGVIPTPSKSPDMSGGIIIITADPTDAEDVKRIEYMVRHIQESCNSSAVCFVSDTAPEETSTLISKFVHSHVVNLSDPAEVARWFETAQQKKGKILGAIHYTGKVPQMQKMTQITRQEWNILTEKFITRPAIASQKMLEVFVPGGGTDPRLYKGSSGSMIIVGPELPFGKKTTGIQRAQAEVFRGALRPFVTTVNQELSDVLGSRIRIFAALPGSVTGAEPDPAKVSDLFDFVMSSQSSISPTASAQTGQESDDAGAGNDDDSGGSDAKQDRAASDATNMSTVIFCTDEAR